MKKYLRVILLGFFILQFSVTTDAQQWKRFRKEFFGGIGATNFLGELGGADQVGTNFVRDLEFLATRPAISGGFRYMIGPNSRLRTSLYWGILKGDDATTNEPYRNNRNLHFRSGITELSAGYEHYLIDETGGHRYNLRGARGMRGRKFTLYGHASIAVMYFNPKAKYDGKWVALQPLGTEGQGIAPGTKKYSRIGIAIPYGLGFKYALDRNWRIGMELGLRKTFTDYLDDVSTNYFDNDILRSERGDVAANLADPNKGNFPNQLDNNTGYSQAGIQRGDPKDKDSYMFGVITLSYKITRRGSRAKF